MIQACENVIPKICDLVMDFIQQILGTTANKNMSTILLPKIRILLNKTRTTILDFWGEMPVESTTTIVSVSISLFDTMISVCS